MASQLKVDTLTGVTTAGSIVVTGEGNSTTTNLQQGLIKQWAKIDGQAAAIDDSFNVSSVSDEAVGKKQLVATNIMSNANYSVTSTVFFDSSIDAGMHPFIETTFSTSEFRIVVLEYNSTNAGDCDSHFTQSTGDLA
jgi:hypothetical protein